MSEKPNRQDSAANGQHVHDDEPCCHPGCDRPAEYPAPRSRRQLKDYLWFCLEHIRDYNKAWDYYAGMEQSEIERLRREDVTWQRPTWPLGAHCAGRGFGPDGGEDFGVFGPEWGRSGAAGEHAANGHRLPNGELRALGELDLTPPVTFDSIRARYMELVKLLHPDANGGDKGAEERLKSVNQAYTTLKNSDLSS